MKWLLDPSEYNHPNRRIDGWKKLREVNARTVKIFVFPLETFAFFKKNNTLPKEFEEELRFRAEEMINNSASHAALIRRAFVVPGLENPPGPRFLGLITPEMVVDAVKELYSFAIKQEYDKGPESQISGWMEPPSTILDHDKFEKDPTLVSIPYGGYALSENGFVEIFAVFGINEGVQSLVADRYTLEARNNRYFVVKKEVPQKNLMMCSTTRAPAQLLSVPTDSQFDQVLSDGEIPEVARVVHELSVKYGPQRVEFSTDEGGICFNEVADYFKDKSTRQADISVRGEVLEIEKIEDLKDLEKMDKEKLEKGETIILVSENVIASRNYDILGTLAAWKDRLYVLYPGVAATQHAMRILADKGHKAFLVGQQKFKSGDEVQITTVGGKIRVTNLTRTENQETVSLWDASLLGTELCGGKALRLSQLKTYGFQVPHGSVCTTKIFEKILTHLGHKELALKDFSKIEQKLENPSKELVAIVSNLLPDYQGSNKKFAVRSSANAEDSRENSMAGIFESYLGISGKDLPKNILLVIKSLFSSRAVEFLKHHESVVGALKMAVVVQEMIPARFAGVIFGGKIQTGDTNLVEIEVNKGSGEDLVSGSAKVVEQLVFNRAERRTVERKGPEYLSSSESRALFMLSERLREEFANTPQDIEWAIDQAGQIWVLQSRDLIIKQ
jgi:pyruvate,water dikinase